MLLSIFPNADTSAQLALNLEVLCRRFSLVRNFFVFDDLALIQSGEASLLDGRNMDKHISSAAALRLNKSVALCRLNHFTVPLGISQVSRIGIISPAQSVDGQSIGGEGLRAAERLRLEGRWRDWVP